MNTENVHYDENELLRDFEDDNDQGMWHEGNLIVTRVSEEHSKIY